MRSIDNLNRLREHLRDIRESKGLSQVETAKVAGVSQSLVAQWESGYAPLSTINTLIGILSKLGLQLYIGEADE